MECDQKWRLGACLEKPYVESCSAVYSVGLLEMLSCTLSMFWTTVTSQTSSEEEWMNRDTVKPTVTFGSRAGFKKGTLLLPCFHKNALSRRELKNMKASLPMRLNLGGNQKCARFTQCEKVDPHMALISVLDRSTKTSCLQFSQAIGPRKLMSDGSFRCSMPDPQRLPSGIFRG